MATKRPALPKVSEEMKRWSVLLVEEVKQWPGTRTGRMFGMISLYRGDTIFALVPDTRGWELPNAIATKLNGIGKSEGEKWQSFAIEDDGELGEALKRLDEAYRRAVK
jgi:hypothetical protein